MPLTITNNSAYPIRYLEWGMESRWLATTGAPSLILDSDNLTASASATSTTRGGAYDPNATGPSVIRATLATQPTLVCSTGNLAHVGTYRVKARVWAVTATTGSVMVRMSHQAGDGPMSPGRYATPPVINNWAEVDLGLITIPPAEVGTQRWTGRVEAFSTTIGDTVDVDVLSLIPAEGYGIARATYAHQPGTLTARDAFTSITAGTALNGRVAPLGGTWATSGATTDWVAADAPLATDETMARSTTGDSGDGRLAILGATNYVDSEVGVRFRFEPGADAMSSVIARYVDASNYLALDAGPTSVQVRQVVAGVSTVLYAADSVQSAGAWYELRLVAYAGGHVYAALLDTNGAVLVACQAASAALATGGALATGKPGFADKILTADGTPARYYDNFYAATPAPEPVVCHPGKSIEITHNTTRRQDATGAYWGLPPTYVGGRFKVPPAGDANRQTRIVVRARRNDIVTSADDQIGDSITVQASITPGYLAVPRG